MAENEEDKIPGERAETVTATRIDNNPVLKRGAVALAIVLFIGFALWSTSGSKTKDNNSQTERVVIRQTTPFEAAREKTEPVEEKPEVQLPTPVLEEPMPEVDELLDAARRAPVMAYSGGQKNSPSRGGGGNGNNAVEDRNFIPIDGNFIGQNQQNADEQRFENLLRPTRLEGSRAGTLANRDFVIAMGTSIPCVLETALASDQPGFASCVINRDVLSDNGRVVLMEKGTQFVGEYRGGLQRGQKRLFVL